MRASCHSARLVAVAFLCALVGCATAPKSSPAPTDRLLRQYATSAQQAFALRSYDRAARFYELALQRARAMDDADQIGAQAYNLAASLLLAGKPADALPYLTEAERGVAKRHQNRGPILLLRARALRAADRSAEARLALDHLLEMDTSREVQCQGWLLLGQIEADQQRADETAKALSRARSFLSDDPVLRAGVAMLAGRYALLRGNAADAALEFDKEVEFMRQAGRYADMARALERAGAAYAAQSNTTAAANRFYRAARSWLGQGDAVHALRAVEQALAQAPENADPAWAPEIAALVDEIRRTPRAGAPDGAAE